MEKNLEHPADRRRVFRKPQEINRIISLSRAAGTLFALCALLTSFFARSGWFSLLAVCFAVTSFAKSYFFLPARQGKLTRSQAYQNYKQYYTAGIILLVLYVFAVLTVIVSRKAGYSYPAAGIGIILLLAVWKLVFYRLYLDALDSLGSYMRGVRHIELQEELIVTLLVFHLVLSPFGPGAPGGFLWIPTALVLAFLAYRAVRMILFAKEKMLRYQKKSRRSD